MKRVISEGALAGSPYSPAVIAGGLCFLAGHLGIDANQHLPDGIEAQTRQALDNLSATLSAAGLDRSHVVRTSIWVRDYADMPNVNKIYADYFTDQHPARTAFQTPVRPLDALFEIDAIAVASP